MRGAISYDGGARGVFGILLALLAVPLTFVWFFFLLAAFNTCAHPESFNIFTCREAWIFTAVVGIIVLGMWVGTFALLSKRIGDERSDS